MDASTRAIQRVTVIGTGMMGPGIAMCFAAGGKQVTLAARGKVSLARGRSNLESCLRDLEAEELLTAGEVSAAMGRVDFSTDIPGAAAGSDLVVESIAEDLAAKQALFAELDKVCTLGTIIASNTSGLRITDISALMSHPERAATTHFWLPPHLMPLVEIVKGGRTSDETAQALKAVLTEIGKRPVVVRKDVPGQLGSRLLSAITREAMYIVQEGIASAEEVDTAIKTGLGLRFPVFGPLDHADVAGLDLVLAVHSYLFKELCNATEPLPILKEKVENGDVGARAGHGFYDWTQRDVAQTKAARDAFIKARLKDLYPPRRAPAQG